MPLAGPPLTQAVSADRLLERGLGTKPDEPALVSAKTRMTWRELDEAAARLAAQ